jgi:hypothetical protein
LVTGDEGCGSGVAAVVVLFLGDFDDEDGIVDLCEGGWRIRGREGG